MRVLKEQIGGKIVDVTDKIELKPQKRGLYRTVLKCVCGAELRPRPIISIYGPLHMPCCQSAIWFEET